MISNKIELTFKPLLIILIYVRQKNIIVNTFNDFQTS
jgi:hypothetical protein